MSGYPVFRCPTEELGILLSLGNGKYWWIFSGENLCDQICRSSTSSATSVPLHKGVIPFPRLSGGLTGRMLVKHLGLCTVLSVQKVQSLRASHLLPTPLEPHLSHLFFTRPQIQIYCDYNLHIIAF